MEELEIIIDKNGKKKEPAKQNIISVKRIHRQKRMKKHDIWRDHIDEKSFELLRVFRTFKS